MHVIRCCHQGEVCEFGWGNKAKISNQACTIKTTKKSLYCGYMDHNLGLMGGETELTNLSRVSSLAWFQRGGEFHYLKFPETAQGTRLIHVQLALSDVPIDVHFLGNLQMGSSASSPWPTFSCVHAACRMYHTASHEPCMAIIHPFCALSCRINFDDTVPRSLGAS